MIEHETAIDFSAEYDIVSVWTTDKVVMSELDRLCATAPAYYKLTHTGTENEEIKSKAYVITNKALLSFGTGL